MRWVLRLVQSHSKAVQGENSGTVDGWVVIELRAFATKTQRHEEITKDCLGNTSAFCLCG